MKQGSTCPILWILPYNKVELAFLFHLGGWYNPSSLKVQLSCHRFLFPNKLG